MTNSLFIPSTCPSHIAITVLVEFALANTLPIQLSRSPLRLFCQLLTCEENWMKIIGKLNPRGNISFRQYGKFHR